MFIYKVERKHLEAYDDYYDQYSGFICIGENKKEALDTHPSGYNSDWSEGHPYTWVTVSQKDTLEVSCIGKANKGQKKGVVLASFHAA